MFIVGLDDPADDSGVEPHIGVDRKQGHRSEQSFDQFGVKGLLVVLDNFLHRLEMGKSFTLRPVVGDGFIDVHKTDDLSQRVDLIALEPLGKTAAINSLVDVEGDFSEIVVLLAKGVEDRSQVHSGLQQFQIVGRQDSAV